jgi:transcriptional regulator with XRE-family HTH domain
MASAGSTERGWTYLRHLRDRERLTRVELAQQLPCSLGHLTNVENGTRAPGPKLIYRLADRFNITDPHDLRRTLPTVPPRGSTRESAATLAVSVAS